jgi:hypothetical protein
LYIRQAASNLRRHGRHHPEKYARTTPPSARRAAPFEKLLLELLERLAATRIQHPASSTQSNPGQKSLLKPIGRSAPLVHAIVRLLFDNPT